MTVPTPFEPVANSSSAFFFLLENSAIKVLLTLRSRLGPRPRYATGRLASRRRSGGALGVGDDRVDDARPGGLRQVVPHALDDLQTGARDRLGGRAAAGHVDERVDVAVDDLRWHLDPAERLGAIAGGDDGQQLTGNPERIVAAVVAAQSATPEAFLVELEPLRSDRAKRRDRALGKSLTVARRRAQQGSDPLGVRLAHLAVPGGGHDRSQREHPGGLFDRHRLG